MGWDIISIEVEKVIDKEAITYYNRSKMFLDSDNIEQALNEIDLAITYSGNNLGFALQKFRILERGNRNNEALELINNLINRKPQYGFFYMCKFILLNEKFGGKDDINLEVNNIKYLVTAYGLDPKEFPDGPGGIQHCINNGYIKKAEEYINILIDINPQLSEIYNLKARCCNEKGNNIEAVRYMNKAIEIEPLISYFHMLSVYLNELNRFEEIILKMDEAIKLVSTGKISTYNQEDLYLLWGAKADAFHRLNMLKESLFSYNSSIEHTKNLPFSFIGKSEVLIKLKRYKEAIECLNDAIQNNHVNGDIYEKMAEAFIHLSNQKQALNYFDKAIAIDPDNKNYYNTKKNQLLTEKKDKLSFFKRLFM